MQLEKTVAITAEDKWKQGGMDRNIRLKMLATIGQPQCYASDSWKKLPHILKANLQAQKWTKEI